jgi:Spy/CpxP family protein refolding chaperone
MKDRLKLTDEQVVKIDTILAHRSAALRSVRTETETRVNAMMDTTRTMIDSVLTPSQQVQMKEIRARRGHDRRE